MDMREHIAGHAQGFNARVTTLGPLSRLFLIGFIALLVLLIIVVAIPLVILGVAVLLVVRFLRATWQRARFAILGDPARFRAGQVDDEGRKNVRVRVRDEEITS